MSSINFKINQFYLNCGCNRKPQAFDYCNDLIIYPSSKSVILFNLKSNQCEKIINGHSAQVNCVRWIEQGLIFWHRFLSLQDMQQNLQNYSGPMLNKYLNICIRRDMNHLFWQKEVMFFWRPMLILIMVRISQQGNLNRDLL